MAEDYRDKIKSRIRKLLNLAGDNAAFEGEITNAMQAAEALMEAHQLSRAEVMAAATAAGPAGAPPVAPPMDRTWSPCYGVNFSGWEVTLANAIAKLVGTVQFYTAKKTREFGAFATSKMAAHAVWYGPAEDAALAAELFGEWVYVVATMAVGKYGGCFRGNGAQYADGFASALLSKAFANAIARRAIVTAGTTALVRVGDNKSLAALQTQTREDSSRWLEKSCGVKLRSGGTRGGYSGSGEAYAHGRNDGNRADFSATRKPKLGAGA